MWIGGGAWQGSVFPVYGVIADFQNKTTTATMMREGRQRPTTSAVHHHNHHHNSNGASIDNSINNDQHDAKSATSYRSTKSSRSSVLERAKEYNRRIDEQNRRRAKSLERQSDTSSTTPSQQTTPRSASAGRVLSQPHHQQSDNSSSNNNHHYPSGNRPSTRERALASVRKEERMVNNSFSSEMSRSHYSGDNSHHPNNHSSNGRSGGGGGGDNGNGNGGRSESGRNHQTASRQREVVSLSSPQPAQQQRSQGPSAAAIAAVAPATTPGSAYSKQSRKDDGRAQQQQQQLATREEYTANRTNKPSPSRSLKSSQHTRDDTHRQQQEAVVTPELLVDALSGHEDGLLAIAERLMEHYDNGYDVMGEAIIDAFADVQKLFQHVVEAAHMEGAAFEASRRESEMAELRKQAAQGGGILSPDDLVSGNGDHPTNLASPSGPSRHDEFIDQDVKDVLTEAIRKGTSLRDANKHQECYQMYEHACQSASSLLPVDSDHRGRLQLSLARAESMNAERACAILRYAMDDVLRSGLRAGRAPLPDPSKRADVVLSKPRDVTSTAPGQAGVIQSSEEALASLVEEMKEMISAPAYDNTPLQGVAERFWHALGEAQKAQLKNEERLEHNLGKLKGDFLLARAVRSTIQSEEEMAMQYRLSQLILLRLYHSYYYQ